jgi:cell division transport system ATP-binding protein
MIKFDQVSKIYAQGFKALDSIDLEIKPGEFISIVGQSGAGKSTLLRMMTGEDRPDEGDVLIEDLSVKDIENNDLPYLRRKIGVVFQDIKLLPKKTVFENVAFAMEVGGYENARIQDEVPKILELVSMERRLDAFPNQLSGGERQRVAIARALAHKPLLLLADEPTGNLDSINSWEIIQLLLKINRFGTTILLATHARELVNSIKRRVVTLEHGKIVSDEEHGRYRL